MLHRPGKRHHLHKHNKMHLYISTAAVNIEPSSTKSGKLGHHFDRRILCDCLHNVGVQHNRQE